jgi:ubiquinone/menaquinone biosynthesis C-methylase UbiE
MLCSNPSLNKVLFDLESGNLPFKSRFFDTIISSFVLNYVSNLNQLLSELHRILKPNGKILIIQGHINPWYAKQSSHSIDDVHRLTDSLFHTIRKSVMRMEMTIGSK